jgi:hypothetical protein
MEFNVSKGIMRQDKAAANRESESGDNVLQVEHPDYLNLTHTNRPRNQSLKRFDGIHTDIICYIVCCTYRIWD